MQLRRTPFRLAVPLLASLLGPALPCRAASPLADAEHLVMQGNVNVAIPKLHAMTTANPADGAAHLLLCRAFYSEELADQASAECDAALTTLSSDSRAQDWAGRAFGIKAGHSGPIAGYKLAGRVKDAFEAAVRLDPNNNDESR